MTKPFDAVAWMRKRRTEIEQEEEGLSWQERFGRTTEALRGDPLWEQLTARAVRPGLRAEDPVVRPRG